MDTLKGEILDKEFAIGRLTKTLEALCRQLEEMDAAAIEARIAEVVTRLAALPKELSKVSRELGQRENQRESLTAELDCSANGRNCCGPRSSAAILAGRKRA